MIATLKQKGTMKKLENLKLIKNRIAKVASTPPVKHLKGLEFNLGGNK